MSAALSSPITPPEEMITMSMEAGHQYTVDGGERTPTHMLNNDYLKGADSHNSAPYPYWQGIYDDNRREEAEETYMDIEDPPT